MQTQIDCALIRDRFLNEIVWSADRTAGSHVLLRLGTPYISILEPRFEPHSWEDVKNSSAHRRIVALGGSLEILISMGSWHFSIFNNTICSHNDISDKIEFGLKYLESQKITDIAFCDFGVANIMFDLGGRLSFIANEDDEEQCAFIMCEINSFISVNSRGLLKNVKYDPNK